jgi:hypothetical protein
MIEVKYKSELKTFYPEEISSMVLTKMKETAEAYLGHDVKDAVIAVPAVSFDFFDFFSLLQLNSDFVAILCLRKLCFIAFRSQ